MAEYIEKQGLIAFLDSLQQPKIPITQGFKFITIDEAIKVVSERPTADVIERSKIDKAIEKIKLFNPHLEDDLSRSMYEDAKAIFLAILERNIGE